MSVINVFLSNIIAYPLIIFRFLVPIALLFILVFIVKHSAKKSVDDNFPSENQKIEKFTIPDNMINREYGIMKEHDYDHYVIPMEKEIGDVKSMSKEFIRKVKIYRKYDSLSHSPITRRRIKARKKREEAFSDLVKAYLEIKNAKHEVILTGGDNGSGIKY